MGMSVTLRTGSTMDTPRRTWARCEPHALRVGPPRLPSRLRYGAWGFCFGHVRAVPPRCCGVHSRFTISSPRWLESLTREWEPLAPLLPAKRRRDVCVLLQRRAASQAPRRGELWEVAVRRGAGFSDRACGGGPLQKETQAECLLREPWGTFDVGGLGTSLQMALRGEARSERTGASHLQVKPGGWLGARSRVCISSPPGPPWNVCLDSYGVKTLSSYRVRVWPATGIAALSRQTRRED